MVRSVVLLFVLTCASAAMGQAIIACPWLAVGTAAKVLGGDVTVATRVDGPFAGSCRFARESGGIQSSIEIVAGPKDTHPCLQDPVKLKALGNEAVQCRISQPAQQSDIISGRVRDVFFVVTMNNVPGATTQEPTDKRLADAYGASALERVAEQVVGNLY